MKKLLGLAVLAGGVLFAVKRNKDAKAEADLWREATAPTDRTFGGSISTNGSAPAKANSSDATNN